VMGLARATGGTVAIGGRVGGLDDERRKVGFMIAPSFFPYLGPYEGLRYLCEVKGVKNAKAEVGRLLRLVGLDGVRKPFKAFSLGMKQRLGVAGALLGSPPIVVLDEPTNGLDPQGIIDMRGIIRDVHARGDTSFIISSHILGELDLVATKYGFLDHGSLIEEVTREALHAKTGTALAVEVDDVGAALGVLRSMGLPFGPGDPGVKVDGNVIRLGTGLERAGEINRALVAGGLTVTGLHKSETTLEGYFMGLVGGGGDG